MGRRRGAGGSATLEGGEKAAVRLRRRQRGSEGGPETAARLGGGSAARREARRRQRGSEGGPETVRFGERECGEVEEAVQCSHSKSHSPFLK